MDATSAAHAAPTEPTGKERKGTQKELALLYHTVSAGETMFQGNEPSITRELSCLS
jgi:hypothetical protein